jgi:putative transposase
VARLPKLAVVIDLYTCRDIGWSMQSRQTTDIVLQEHSVSRCRNCHDNAVADSFFNLPKRERIRRRTYKTRFEAWLDGFGSIETFYNQKRKHVRNGMLSPVDFERQHNTTTEGIQKTRGYSVNPHRSHHQWLGCF